MLILSSKLSRFVCRVKLLPKSRPISNSRLLTDRSVPVWSPSKVRTRCCLVTFGTSIVTVRNNRRRLVTVRIKARKNRLTRSNV